jgi:hypothetical protein
VILGSGAAPEESAPYLRLFFSILEEMPLIFN